MQMKNTKYCSEQFRLQWASCKTNHWGNNGNSQLSNYNLPGEPSIMLIVWILKRNPVSARKLFIKYTKLLFFFSETKYLRRLLLFPDTSAFWKYSVLKLLSAMQLFSCNTNNSQDRREIVIHFIHSPLGTC